MLTRREIVSFPPVLETNPYQRLLYEHLAEHGYRIASARKFSVRALVRDRGRVGALHFHWPQGYYYESRGPRWVRRLLSWPRIALFAARLATARALSYRIVWTIHQVIPHEPLDRRLDLVAARVLARMSDLLLANDNATAQSAREQLGRPDLRIHVLAHGSFIGEYPAGRGRDEVRESLGIPRASTVFLTFGYVRPYKDTGLLLDAFRRVASPDAFLIVAGPPLDERAAAPVTAAARQDPRIRPLLGFVEDERVAELFGASDAAVVARADGGTSSSVILGMSFGRPVVAARKPVYEELLGGEAAGWLFEPGDAPSLTRALEAVASDLEGARARGAEALRRAERLRWDETAAGLAALLD